MEEQSPKLANELKQGILKILNNALAPYKDDYKKNNKIIWGLVEKDICDFIDRRINDKK